MTEFFVALLAPMVFLPATVHAEDLSRGGCEHLLTSIRNSDLHFAHPSDRDAVPVAVPPEALNPGVVVDVHKTNGQRIQGEVVATSPLSKKAKGSLLMLETADGTYENISSLEVAENGLIAHIKDPREIHPGLSWLHPINQRAAAVHFAFAPSPDMVVEIKGLDEKMLIGQVNEVTSTDVTITRLKPSGELGAVVSVPRSQIREMLGLEAFDHDLAEEEFLRAEMLDVAPIQAKWSALKRGDHIRFVTRSGQRVVGDMVEFRYAERNGDEVSQRRHRIYHTGEFLGELRADDQADVVVRAKLTAADGRTYFADKSFALVDLAPGSLARYRRVPWGNESWSWRHPLNGRAVALPVKDEKDLAVGDVAKVAVKISKGERQIVVAVQAVEGKSLKASRITPDGRAHEELNLSVDEVIWEHSARYVVPVSNVTPRK